MACELWREKLDAYVDGELPREDEQAFREHFKSCDNCAADALDRVQMKRSIQAAAMRYRPDPALRARVRSSIAAPSSTKRTWRWAPSFAFAAACVVLIAALWTSHFRRYTREQQLVSELVDLHVATLASASPVDVVSTDRHTVKPWFEGKLPFTFDLPELQGSPFTLIGGRTSYLNQSPGAELIFRIRQHNISAFIFQESAIEQNCRLASASDFNFHLESWSRNGLCYFVVGDVNAEDLGKLAALLKG
jgi:anti-sigma factor RsiW